MTNMYIFALVAIVGIFAIVLLNVIAAFNKRAEKQEDAYQSERVTWVLERKELMDRIQAGSYAELKQQEIRVIKAQKDEPQAIDYSNLL